MPRSADLSPALELSTTSDKPARFAWCFGAPICVPLVKTSGKHCPMTAKRKRLELVPDTDAREDLIRARRRCIGARYKRGIQRGRHRAATRCVLVQALHIDVGAP